MFERLRRFFGEETSTKDLPTLALVAEKTYNAVVITNAEGLIEWVNDGFTQISGYTLEEVQGRKPGSLLQGPDTDPNTVRSIGQQVRAGLQIEEEILNYHKNGTPYWIQISINPVHDDAGKLIRFIAIERDITEQKANELRLRELSLVAEQTDNAVIITDPNGSIQWVNAGFTRISGYDLADVHGRKPGTFLQGPDTDPATVARIRQQLNQCVPVRETILNYHKDGTPYWLQLSIDPVFDANGELRRFIAIELDVTAERTAAEVLRSTIDTLTKREEELNEANEELQQTATQLNEANQVLTERNDDVQASIRYASRIQAAMLPSVPQLEQAFGAAFVLYQPKDIVSGDFYWLHQDEHDAVLVVADCTGHGVPGALLSMLGHTKLNQLVTSEGLRSPAQILTGLQHSLLQSLATQGHTVYDGMDVAVLRLHKSSGVLTFAGANRPAWLVSEKGVELLPYDRIALGTQTPELQPHQITEWKGRLLPNETLFLATDGIADQTGGEFGRKMGRSVFTLLLEHLHNVPNANRHRAAEQYIHEWRGDHQQVDDLLLVGLTGAPVAAVPTVAFATTDALAATAVRN